MHTLNLGPNEQLIDASTDLFEANVATPALCLDRPQLMANIQSMQAAATAAGAALRPHMKAHKCSLIAQLQSEAGAIGVCCATAQEAEIAAAAGVGSILITTPVVSPMVLERLVALARRGVELLMAVDTVEGIDRVADAADGTRIGTLIDINVGQNRTGISEPPDAVRLAQHIAGSPSLELRGVQAYYGHLQHVPALVDRRTRIEQQLPRLRAILAQLQADGHSIEIVSGGGTGTAALDLQTGLFTEIQPGSYLFLDSQYAAVELGPIPIDFSLSVLGRITSTAVTGQAVVDIGTKALSTDPGLIRLMSSDAGSPTHNFMGDEHSVLAFANPSDVPPVGTLVRLAATHCDPTVNLHDRYLVLESGRLIDIWPIEARGY